MMNFAQFGRKALALAKQQAKTLFSMTEKQIKAAVVEGFFEEI
jgi:hypothetical protein